MKTIRRLALLALFGFAPIAAAGPPAGNVPSGNEPARNAPRLFTHDELAKLLKERYKSVEKSGEGDDTSFQLPKLAHVTEGGKETMSWSVHVKLHPRANRSPVVRIFFPCQALPATPNAALLEGLMGMNGVIQDSSAYFVVGGKDRMISLVVEVSTENLTAGGLQTEITGLLLAAERTSKLWAAKLDSAPAAKPEKSPLTGEWNVHDIRYNFGSAPPMPFVSGLNSMFITADGKVTAYAHEGEEKDQKPRFQRKGTYTVNGDQLTLHFDGRKTPEIYTFKVNDGKVTLTPDKNNEDGITKNAVTLNKWD